MSFLGNFDEVCRILDLGQVEADILDEVYHYIIHVYFCRQRQSGLLFWLYTVVFTQKNFALFFKLNLFYDYLRKTTTHKSYSILLIWKYFPLILTVVYWLTLGMVFKHVKLRLKLNNFLNAQHELCCHKTTNCTIWNLLKVCKYHLFLPTRKACQSFWRSDLS